MCIICGKPAQDRCTACKETFSVPEMVYFCNSCSNRVHGHPGCSHLVQMFSDVCEELQLLSVICVEYNHYVCFSRDSEGRWVFFDSMGECKCRW